MENEKDYSLSDDRRVKTLSPGALTAKRFFRNRLAVVGLVILAFMFLFSFLGGALIPYAQDQVFYREDLQQKEYAAVTRNDTYRFTALEEGAFSAAVKAQLTLALGKKDSFSYGGKLYQITLEGEDLYSVTTDGTAAGIAYKDIVHLDSGQPPQYDFLYPALQAYTNSQTGFSVGEKVYTLLTDGSILQQGESVGYISRLVVQSRIGTTQISRDFRAKVQEAIDTGLDSFSLGGREYTLLYDPASRVWSVREATLTRVWDAYASPSPAHPLGTDKNGMDMLTRLMYGGRISLVIGFIVVLISAVLGVTLGGCAGYFGGWVDNLIMRIVDIFYCIPSTPLLIILGAAMDGMRVDPQVRMLYLMLILGFLGWPSIARLVRGQILSLREQEFMTAAEAGGLSIRRRIFRHLIPNVIPQLIVTCTMSLGSTIITEATLSFLGLGVKFPFASWGNIMNDVSNAHVLTSYWFVWIPAGVCLVLSVLGFNFVGDGLRDAFDPKMKR